MKRLIAVILIEIALAEKKGSETKFDPSANIPIGLIKAVLSSLIKGDGLKSNQIVVVVVSI